jgi:hypothetical protein
MRPLVTRLRGCVVLVILAATLSSCVLGVPFGLFYEEVDQRLFISVFDSLIGQCSSLGGGAGAAGRGDRVRWRAVLSDEPGDAGRDERVSKLDLRDDALQPLVLLTRGSSATSLTGLRVFSRLQVSPAPAVASFGDVPRSHPFFPCIEALKASGITGGCNASPPLFCPDAPF